MYFFNKILEEHRIRFRAKKAERRVTDDQGDKRQGAEHESAATDARKMPFHTDRSFSINVDV
ncbi:protein of unknown function [Methylocaldum szegediense]|uniref:Transposase n=1 Tax=Methylocaldum szegediense TaxID=73780 RepID=A0ABN8XB77_9GAMM|nr:protein of unknown function [Methylocaldum szegediense]